ncbi:chemotaxis protein CheR [Neokomagataea thailandica NBRC 106555]|uniref:Chemotaxis protein methyltransferase n=2 Tax=Neokomagataea TaxID=1223423 RepID=A0A4Y6V4D1_9PROT|nr:MULTISPECIES: protein-glutamate O-methyltransferase CheR [Neokomagataea]QDH24793.1 protein-glutamate O-methyltransferase CheR [Neokomagataea tanensis]GBR52708.1 chemotaxis protein CheR [Neokomagataea thailandica NBRC 106555]
MNIPTVGDLKEKNIIINDLFCSVYDISNENTLIIAGIVKKYSGLNIDLTKKPLIISRLSRRLRLLKCNNFDDYIKYISMVDNTHEKEQMAIALTTNTTAFFREAHHFDALRSLCKRRVSHDVATDGAFRIWCAAASSGEEAYSAVFSVVDLFKNKHQKNLRVLATDINPYVLEKARNGTYLSEYKYNIPKNLFNEFCVENKYINQFSIDEKIRSKIFFEKMNLIQKWPIEKKMDAIFCRNIFIYFDKETKENVLRRMLSHLHIGGEIYFGHSEHIRSPERYGLEACGVTAYRKVAN